MAAAYRLPSITTTFLFYPTARNFTQSCIAPLHYDVLQRLPAMRRRVAMRTLAAYGRSGSDSSLTPIPNPPSSPGVALAPPTPSQTTPAPLKGPPHRGFYRRRLPPGCIPFSSNRGRQLFREALAAGGMEGYFALAEQFHTQSEPEFCGPSTLAMILNALALDPNRIWKGPWRWYSEEMLECCAPFVKDMKKQGITFEEFALLGRCNGAHVQAFLGYPDTVPASETANTMVPNGLALFRRAVMAATSRHDLHVVRPMSM
jgi:hypothetical protein